jgi:hypothetical protein
MSTVSSLQEEKSESIDKTSDTEDDEKEVPRIGE